MKVTREELKAMILSGEDVTNVDVSGITDMGYMFDGCTSFDQDISGWDTGSVTNMRCMLQECKSFNQDISGWDVSNVTDMVDMFVGCESLQTLPSWYKG